MVGCFDQALMQEEGAWYCLNSLCRYVLLTPMIGLAPSEYIYLRLYIMYNYI